MKEILAAIRSVEPKEWEAFFESLRQEQYTKVAGVLPEQLSLLQSTVKSLFAIEERFKQLRDGKITVDKKNKN